MDTQNHPNAKMVTKMLKSFGPDYNIDADLETIESIRDRMRNTLSGVTDRLLGGVDFDWDAAVAAINAGTAPLPEPVTSPDQPVEDMFPEGFFSNGKPRDRVRDLLGACQTAWEVLSVCWDQVRDGNGVPRPDWPVVRAMVLALDQTQGFSTEQYPEDYRGLPEGCTSLYGDADGVGLIEFNGELLLVDLRDYEEGGFNRRRVEAAIWHLEAVKENARMEMFRRHFRWKSNTKVLFGG